MTDLALISTATTHQLYAAARTFAGRCGDADGDNDLAERDRGAVSLEQVLWFVAAGVSVAVIAAILWNQIRDEAEKTPTAPVAP
jgi:hypothetical protein